MSMIEDIKKDMMIARKSNDPVAKPLLITLYSEASMKGKNERNGDPTDQEVISVIKKFKSNAEETLQIAQKHNNQDKAEIAEKEIQILDQYLPKQMTEDELKNVISDIIAKNNLSSPREIGVVMKNLNENHNGTFDGKQASTLAKELLA